MESPYCSCKPLAVLSLGGLYDHVVPPFGIPSDESPCNVGNIPPHPGSRCGRPLLRALLQL